jgi:hypothetical protein
MRGLHLLFLYSDGSRSKDHKCLGSHVRPRGEADLSTVALMFYSSNGTATPMRGSGGPQLAAQPYIVGPQRRNGLPHTTSL